MKKRVCRFLVALFGSCAAMTGAGAEVVEISVDPARPPIKDISKSSSAPDIGFGADFAEGVHTDASHYFRTDRAGTARVFREAGVKLVRPQDSLIRWQGERASRREFYERYHRFPWGRRALDMKKPWSWTDPHNVFSFWKENGIKAILNLHGEVYDTRTDRMTKETEMVKETIVRYLKWIRENGYAETVAGFEMENEPYFGQDPDGYARKWRAILPAMRAVWPEIPIGFPVAEYRQNDPDLACVRRRSLQRDAVKTNDVHSAAHVNQWTGNAIVAMGDGLKHVTHIVYHVYGADTYYSCNYAGIERLRRLMKAFPEIRNKRIWVTEWRDRAEEDLRSQMKFRTTIWKAHYILMLLAQPDVDAFNHWTLHDWSGAIYQSIPECGNTWYGQRDPGGRFYRDWATDGTARLEVGNAGPMFRYFTQGVTTHPRIMAHGATYGFHACSTFYDSLMARQRADLAGRKKEDLPPVKGDFEWVAALNAEKTSLALLAVNSKDVPVRAAVRVAGKRLLPPVYRVLDCDPALLDAYEVPGEGKPWRARAWQCDPVSRDPYQIEIAPNTIALVEIAFRRN